MSVPRLFLEQALSPNSTVAVSGNAARYVGRVLRSRPGDSIVVFDGHGGEISASVLRIGKHEVVLQLGAASRPATESPLTVRLLQGISRGDRMDFVVQKTTELGVRQITPLQTEFSVVRLDAQRAAKRQQHWQRISASACEQCGRNVLPVIDGATTLAEFLSEEPVAGTTRILLSPGASQTVDSLTKPAGAIEMLIGPEGGFSEQEMSLAREHQFLPVAIGPRVLRTETAAVTALSLVQAYWGDLAAAPRPGG